MLVFWPCALLAAAFAHRVEESTEDILPPPAPPLLSQRAGALNSTALYPVNNTNTNKIKAATSWKIETTFGESKLDSNSTDSKETLAVDRPGNRTSSSEFRASPQLGNFVDEDSLEAGGGLRPTHQPGGYGGHRPTNGPPGDFAGAIKKPPTGFMQSLKEHKFPKESFKQYDFPYKVESPILTRAKDGWKPAAAGLEPHPTDEAPIRVPAGGLYTLPDPFKIKPGTTDEDFGLEFSHDVKEHPIKKPRDNPWKSLLHLLTALIPVGIIFSALTPNVITIAPDPSHPFRRADGSLTPPPPPPPPVSERCRRRLLCELHNETNFPYSSSRKVRGKQCYRLRCEDPEGLARTLQWLLSHQRLTDRPGTTVGPTATEDQWDLKVR